MSNATNKAIVRRYFEEVFNQQRHDLIEEFLADEFELHFSGLPPGVDAVKDWYTAMVTAFPDGQLSIDDVLAEGDKVAARTSFSGTQQGEMQGIPASGKRASSMPSITIFRLANGKIAEGWIVNDNLGLMQQLGVIPTPETA
jgi:steroid delta-isomerase-like uncharacterized protein